VFKVEIPSYMVVINGF